MSTALTRQRMLSGLNLTRKKTQTLAIRKYVSTESHTEHHHEHHHDSTTYPEESFNTPFWKGIALTVAIGFGIYTIAPLFDEDGSYIKRYIQQYKTSPEIWSRINLKHLEQTLGAAENQLTTSSALRPTVHRLRHPAAMEYACARNVPIGADNVLKDVVVKRDDSWS